MARMMPDVAPSELKHASEAPVYSALRTLGNSYIVLHSYPWLRAWRGGLLSEGEADFVILHPNKGLLVLEVKGGKSIQYTEGKWSRSTPGGPRAFKDPFVQAQRNMHALLDIIEERSRKRISRNDLTYGYAVVFPHMNYDGSPPPHADRAIVISSRDLVSMEQAISTAMAKWGGGMALPEEKYRSLLHDCLMPKFRLYRPVGPDIENTTSRLLELTEMQATVFEGLYNANRVLVKGVAGSGKTFLALQRALAFAKEGKRTLFVCYNKELAIWLAQRVEEDPSTSGFRDHLTIVNFHALVAETVQKANLRFAPEQGGGFTHKFWTEEAPELLEQAVFTLQASGQPILYEAVVIDEAQDFTLEWWYAITELLNKPDGPIYAFMDPNQSLWGEVDEPPVEFDLPFDLRINCRNSREIAVTSASVLDLDVEPFNRARAGVEPRFVQVSDQRKQKDAILRELVNLLDRDDIGASKIALIGPSAKDKGSLDDVHKVSGVSLVVSASEWRKGKGVLVTTARSFKGLEADVVLLYDLNKFHSLFTKQDLYVACTRAKALLIAIVHGEEVVGVIENAMLRAQRG